MLNLDTYKRICAEFPVIDSAPANIALEAERLIVIKHSIDAFSKRGGGVALLPPIQEMTGYSSTITPFSFFLGFLPFYKFLRRRNPDRPSGKFLVPTEMVVGESWNWSPSSLNSSEQQAVVDSCCKAFELSDGTRAGSECADYVYIKPLGLVIAHEGKNRVALFRANGMPYIPAFVSEESYPDPSRLDIYELKNITLAVLDERYIERIEGFGMTRALLGAYGAKIEARWPAHYPAEDRVIAALSKNHCGGLIQDPVDMHDVKEEESIDATIVKVSLPQLTSCQWFSWRFALGMPIISSGSLLLTFNLAAFPLLQGAFGMFSLLTIAICVLPMLEIWSVRIKDLRPDEHAKYFYEERARRRNVNSYKKVIVRNSVPT